MSSLNHPNILVVHDFAEHEGRPFIVTEYVEGETPRDPAGYTWWIATRKEDFTRAELDQRADAFFKALAA